MHKINKLHLDLINNFIFEIDFKNIYIFFKKKKKIYEKYLYTFFYF